MDGEVIWQGERYILLREWNRYPAFTGSQWSVLRLSPILIRSSARFNAFKASRRAFASASRPSPQRRSAILFSAWIERSISAAVAAALFSFCFFGIAVVLKPVIRCWSLRTQTRLDLQDPVRTDMGEIPVPGPAGKGMGNPLPGGRRLLSVIGRRLLGIRTGGILYRSWLQRCLILFQATGARSSTASKNTVCEI